MTFDQEDARREHFLARLKEKLPELRQRPDFPVADVRPSVTESAGLLGAEGRPDPRRAHGSGAAGGNLPQAQDRTLSRNRHPHGNVRQLQQVDPMREQPARVLNPCSFTNHLVTTLASTVSVTGRDPHAGGWRCPFAGCRRWRMPARAFAPETRRRGADGLPARSACVRRQ